MNLKYLVMLILAVALMPSYAMAEYDLENEKIAGIHLNMTVAEAKETLEAEGYRETLRERKYLIFEKDAYRVDVVSDIGNSSDLQQGKSEANMLTGLSFHKKLMGKGHEVFEPRIEQCQIVQRLLQTYCATEAQQKERNCTLSSAPGAIQGFSMRQETGNHLTKGGFTYSATFGANGAAMCQVSLQRHMSQEVKRDYMFK